MTPTARILAHPVAGLDKKGNQRGHIAGSDEIVELPWPDGRTVRTTRWAMQDFLNSLSEDDHRGYRHGCVQGEDLVRHQ